MAKIGFNYFAYFNGTPLLLDNQFDLIRNFILTGDEPDWPLTRVDSEPILFDEKYSYRLGHLITIGYADDNQSVIAQVSLFNEFRYTI